MIAWPGYSRGVMANIEPRPPRLVIAEDETLLRKGVVRLLVEAGFQVVADVGTAPDAIQAVAQHEPDVLVIDVRMPPGFSDEGLRVASRLGATMPEVGVLVLSHYIEAQYVIRLLERRSSGIGYVLKQSIADVALLTDAIRRVAAGGVAVDREVVVALRDSKAANARLSGLSPRERELLTLMAEGRSNRGLEKLLGLSGKTVESHIRNIFAKLGLQEVEDDQRRVLAVLAYLRARDDKAREPA